MKKHTQQLLLMLVIGILIGATFVSAWKLRGSPDVTDTHNSTPSGATNTDMVYKPATQTIQSVPNLPSAPEIPAHLRVGMNVSDQPAGSSVFVTGLSITERKWVAVYEEADGRPGSILGASHVFPGYISTSVELIRNTKPDNTYFVAILNDDGDDDFNIKSDLPPTSLDKFVIVSFVAK